MKREGDHEWQVDV